MALDYRPGSIEEYSHTCRLPWPADPEVPEGHACECGRRCVYQPARWEPLLTLHELQRQQHHAIRTEGRDTGNDGRRVKLGPELPAGHGRSVDERRPEHRQLEIRQRPCMRDALLVDERVDGDRARDHEPERDAAADRRPQAADEQDPRSHEAHAEHLADHYHPRFKIPDRQERETMRVG